MSYSGNVITNRGAVQDRGWRDERQSHAFLIVEVSDTTLSYDRNRKGSFYARAGILDYWIVNLVNQQLDVYRQPMSDATQHYGYRYAERTDLVPPATVSPLLLPHATLTVAQLLA